MRKSDALNGITKHTHTHTHTHTQINNWSYIQHAFLVLTVWIQVVKKPSKQNMRETFPGGPVAKTKRFQCRRPRFDSWSGN